MILYEDYKNGTPIALIVRPSTANTKTGPIPTLWGIVADMTPRDAVNSGVDEALCGDCEHRKGGPGVRCYTYTGRTLPALAGIHKTYNRGSYIRADFDTLVDFLRYQKRLGATAIRSMGYGDMAAFPAHVWEMVDEARRVAKLTVRGYTQQWERAAHLRETHMASCSTLLRARQAEAAGWRVFLTTKQEPVGMVNCPASKEAGHLTTCNQCTLCYGASRQAPSVWIKEH